jgi:hypothetical protein
MDVTAMVTLEDDLPSGNWRLYIYMIEDNINNDYPFVVRGIEYHSLTIENNGEQQSEVSTFRVRGNYNKDEIIIGAFVEDHNGSSNYNIHQGAMLEDVIASITSSSLGKIKTLFQ